MGTLVKGRYSFWIRAGLALVLIVVADRSLWAVQGLGANLAIPLLAAVAALAIASPAARRHSWPFLLLAGL